MPIYIYPKRILSASYNKTEYRKTEHYPINKRSLNTMSGDLLYYNVFTELAQVVFPLGISHIAALEELLVHSQCATQRMRRVCRL